MCASCEITCASWCASHPSPWSTKCDWYNCQTCGSCDLTTITTHYDITTGVANWTQWSGGVGTPVGVNDLTHDVNNWYDSTVGGRWFGYYGWRLHEYSIAFTLSAEAATNAFLDVKGEREQARGPRRPPACWSRL